MKAYPSYKSSGITWIGEVPEHWEEIKFKYSEMVIMGQSPSSEDYNFIGDGFPFLQGNGEFADIYPNPKHYCPTANKIAKCNDILLSVRAPIGAINIADQEYGIGRGLCAIRSKSSNFKFIYYQLLTRNPELNSIGTGSTYSAVSIDEIENLIFLRPPLIEQYNIVSFLDLKTSEIDSLIAKKQRQIQLYEEEKTAIINKAVSKGINPDAKMKDSGIFWLGEVPDHWEITRLKRSVSKIGSGVTPTGGASVYQTEGIPFIRSQNVHFDGMKLDDIAYISDEIDSNMANTRIAPGDVLLNITGASIGRCYFIEESFGPGNVNQHVCIIRPEPLLVKTKFLYFFLRSSFGQLQIDLCQTGANREGLNFEQIKGFTLVLPSTKEQQEIIDLIEEKIRTINQLQSSVKKQIELLSEYKTSLISEVVTGKIKVDLI